MKQNVNAFDYADRICKAMGKGILLTTRSGARVNTMTIGWGHIGIEWNKPVFVAYVRQSRYTRELLDETGEFTVNIPLDSCDSQILRICGTKSGRDTDKTALLGLTKVESDIVAAPGFRELPLTLECKVIYRQEQDLNALGEEDLARFYPVLNEAGFRDGHIAYYGQIVNAYLAQA